MSTARVAYYEPPERFPMAKLQDRSPTYRVAVEAYKIVCDLGVSGDVEAAIWALCQREADAAQGIGLGGK